MQFKNPIKSSLVISIFEIFQELWTKFGETGNSIAWTAFSTYKKLPTKCFIKYRNQKARPSLHWKLGRKEDFFLLNDFIDKKLRNTWWGWSSSGLWKLKIDIFCLVIFSSAAAAPLRNEGKVIFANGWALTLCWTKTFKLSLPQQPLQPPIIVQFKLDAFK